MESFGAPTVAPYVLPMPPPPAQFLGPNVELSILEALFMGFFRPPIGKYSDRANFAKSTGPVIGGNGFKSPISYARSLSQAVDQSFPLQTIIVLTHGPGIARVNLCGSAARSVWSA
eukprot:CAMPEP_0183547734 /NCGR_PEP_ID=MMETSP0371-20130417/57558_1 /TAXON_ID=268820 /ORGANISM="Peridinium aciculiferum, Strain PAER-2" /LENGTH=115 /DNA_ID=CAMNT_0025750789 /DNA_START=176 /DNA_END=523 /DNA_ORIENTATION=-